MLRSPRLRFALVLLAILPGLLFQGVGTLRVCLHDWTDLADECIEATDCCAPIATHAQDCCAINGAEAEETASVYADACEGCCIQIGSDSAVRLTPPSEMRGDFVSYTAPIERIAFEVPVPSTNWSTARPVIPVRTQPRHAPTPLRI